MRAVKILASLAMLLIFAPAIQAQDCNGIGQIPSSAFPVCGTQTFTQESVPICGHRGIPGPVCTTYDNGPHLDTNPYWYKFTCYKSGTLGFTITPKVMSDDYDWQLFDVTGRNPNDVYTDLSLYVTMNWSGERGITGASSDGTSLDVCGGGGLPLFSKMATLTEGHDYLLLISHFTQTQSGYTLEFGGGTADITDPVVAHLQQASYNCGPYSVGIKLSKSVRCNSLDKDGSDFTFVTPGPKIVGATGIGCSNGFDLDSLTLQLDKPLAPGTYTIASKTGNDKNTLLDACGNFLSEDERLTFTVTETPPAEMGVIKTPPCAPNELQLEFRLPIQCSSIDPGGKDFVLSGPSDVKITGAAGTCNGDGLTWIVRLQLDKRILKEGDYKVTLVKGPDGNTIESECHVAAPPGETAGFNVPPQPYAPLGPVAALPCAPNEIKLVFQDAVRCSSVAKDGSDFTITGPSAAAVTGAITDCDGNGLTKTVTLELKDRILQDGDYQVELKKGTDNNTLQNECWQETPAGSVQPFNIAPQPKVLLGAAAAPGCSPAVIRIGVSVPVRCSSIAPDGSDFTISGPKPVQIIKATGICNGNNLADSIDLQLSAAIQDAGDYAIAITTGKDNNTLQSECWQPADPGQRSGFRTADTVNADFSYTLEQECRITSLQLHHNGKNGVNQWLWSFDDGDTYTVQHPEKVYETLGNKHISLIVSNGVCTDTRSKDTLIRSEVTALFDVSPGPYCPLDVVIPENKSLGNIVTWTWQYGNGAISTGAQPLHMQYYPVQKEETYVIRLIVKNDAQCLDTAEHSVMAVSSCYIDVPTAFSPNNDGQNDFLYPLSAYKAVDLRFSVYNRLGNLLFETNDWTKKWDGTVNGQPADVGTYVWMLEYTEKESGKRVFRKGTTVLLR